MGEQKGLYRLVGKTMLDADFRGWLLDEPEAAAESIGVSLTEEQVEHFHQVDREAVEELAQCVESAPQLHFLAGW